LLKTHKIMSYLWNSFESDNYNVKHQSHTRYALAIISAFSVIEELELEVCSSSKKHRFINKNTGD